MSTFVHCMICFVFPAPDLKFFLSGCGHVACFKCVQKGSMTIKCKVCQKDNPQILEINRSLRPQLLELFTPLSDGFTKVVRDIGHASDFQNGHRQRLMRHFHIKSSNFEKLQNFCREEIKKKNQYKQELHRMKIEYKKKCEETAELKARIGKMENCTVDLNDMTHDPFRTPAPGKLSLDQRSFLTSTPFRQVRGNVTDITESTMSATGQTDSSTSFAALGIPLLPVDPSGEVLKLARLTSTLCRKELGSKNGAQQDKYSDDMVFNKGCKNRPIFPTDENISSAFEKDSDDVDADALTPQDSSTATTVQVPSKAPLTKKSRLDFMSKTQPLPLKSL